MLQQGTSVHLISITLSITCFEIRGKVQDLYECTNERMNERTSERANEQTLKSL